MKHNRIFGLVAVVFALVLTGCDKGGMGGGTPSLDTDDDKSIYLIGHDMGSKLQTLSLSDKELKTLLAGLRDGIQDKKSPVDQREFLPKITKMIRGRTEKLKEKEVKESTAFLSDIEKKDGVVKLESGMMIKEIKAGEGEVPKATDRVEVHYHGTLRNGSVFDSSKDRGTPAKFALNRVIPCWTEGLQKMKKGGKAMLYCPPKLAYGDRGAPPKIKPGAALVFEVELLNILGEDKTSGMKSPDFQKMLSKLKTKGKDGDKKKDKKKE